MTIPDIVVTMREAREKVACLKRIRETAFGKVVLLVRSGLADMPVRVSYLGFFRRTVMAASTIRFVRRYEDRGRRRIPGFTLDLDPFTRLEAYLRTDGGCMVRTIEWCALGGWSSTANVTGGYAAEYGVAEKLACDIVRHASEYEVGA